MKDERKGEVKIKKKQLIIERFYMMKS